MSRERLTGSTWMLAHLPALFRIANEVCHLEEGCIELCPQAGVLTHFAQSLSHAHHPGITCCAVQAKGLMPTTQHGCATLG